MWLSGFDEAKQPLTPAQVRGPAACRKQPQPVAGMHTPTSNLVGGWRRAALAPGFLSGQLMQRCAHACMQVLEDVSEEHAKKTITVDPHPHMTLSAASIHPCRWVGLGPTWPRACWGSSAPLRLLEQLSVVAARPGWLAAMHSWLACTARSPAPLHARPGGL
jgi:hypothetical protein